MTDILQGQVVTLIDESEFSALVTKIYGRPYRFQQQGDMKCQDTIETFSVPSEEYGGWTGPSLTEWQIAPPPDGDFKEELRWHRDFYPELEVVVNDLYARGLIAAGDYALHVWW